MKTAHHLEDLMRVEKEKKRCELKIFRGAETTSQVTRNITPGEISCLGGPEKRGGKVSMKTASIARSAGTPGSE